MTVEFAYTHDELTRAVWSVAQLNRAVARLLEEGVPTVWVQGEISNFTQAASGHWYFTLKDAQAGVKAVMFRFRAQAVGFTPRAGDRVAVRARVSLYEARGDYQLQVEAMRRAGLGDVYEAFLRLKEKLAAQGLFEAARKRTPARLPACVGVITSLQAAALRDVLSVFKRRAPHVAVIVYPAPVQGLDAAAKLVDALATANRLRQADTLLLVRGGGSIEDLASFNDEALAHAIAASALPVISGVGHETDFTIADFVADMRAPTPTAAAELACAARHEWLDRVSQAGRLIVRAQARRLERCSQDVDRLTVRLVSPTQRLAHQRARLSALARQWVAACALALTRRQSRLALAQQRLIPCRPEFDAKRSAVMAHSRDLRQRVQRALDARRLRLQSLADRLRTLDPTLTLARGYAIVRDDAGEIVRDAAQLSPGQRLALQFANGQTQATVDAKP